MVEGFISTLAQGDTVEAPSLGTGKVVAIDERPSARVDFDRGGMRWITNLSAELLNVTRAGA